MFTVTTLITCTLLAMANGDVLLQKHACVSLSSLSTSMTFAPVARNSECAMLCAAYASCAGVAIDSDTNGKQCTLLSNDAIPPFNTLCDDPSLTVTIYRNIYTVQDTIWVYGTCHCLYNAGEAHSSRDVALGRCRAIYGDEAKLPEVATTSDLEMIYDISQSGKSAIGRIWMAADDVINQGSYVWSSGNPVNVSLWHNIEGIVNQECTYLNRIYNNNNGVFGMFECFCTLGVLTQNVVCSVTNCSQC